MLVVVPLVTCDPCDSAFVIKGSRRNVNNVPSALDTLICDEDNIASSKHVLNMSFSCHPMQPTHFEQDPIHVHGIKQNQIRQEALY